MSLLYQGIIDFFSEKLQFDNIVFKVKGERGQFTTYISCR